MTDLISWEAWSLVLQNILSAHVVCRDHPVKTHKRQYCLFLHVGGARGGAVVWGTELHTKRKVAGSTPDDVFGIFHWLNPSGPTMALGSTKPLTKMNTRIISWVKAAGVLGWQAYHVHVTIVLKFGSLSFLEPSGSVKGLLFKHVCVWVWTLVLGPMTDVAKPPYNATVYSQ